MNKIEEMIEELCPDGVEFRNLNEVSEMQRGTSLTKSKSVFGKYPVISGGKEPAFYCNQYNRDGEIITVAGSGVGAGYVQFWNEPIFVSDAFSIKANKNCLAKFLFYVLQNNQEYIYSKKQGAGIPHVYISDIQNLQIPIPPVKIQSEIVRMLDTFTNLISELTNEVILRKKQYEYYRDQLLTFNSDVEFVNLGDVCEMKAGKSISSSDIYQEKRKDYFPVYGGNGFRGYYKTFSHEGSFSIIGRQGALCGNVQYAEGKFYATEHAVVVSDLKNLESRFLYHLLTYMNLNQYKTAGAQPGLSVSNLKSLQIPIPPIEQQKKITAILDRFDKLCNDLTSGIPAEINARKKQYEYYRDKLLTFTQK